MKKSRGFRNFVITGMCQMTMLLFGMILPRITITNLGSEANGFLSSINDIFVYVSLLEGGLGIALLNALYEPINRGDVREISDVMTAARLKYKMVSVAYLIVTIVIAFLFPLFAKSQLSYVDMVITILAQGIGGAAMMYLSSSICQYLIAAGRNYIREIIHLVFYVLISLSKVFLIIKTGSIVIVTIAYSVLCVIEASVYNYYFLKKIPSISLNSSTPRFDNLSEQKYFLIHQISSAVFSSTDVFTISIFCSFTASSIYSVYALVFNAISTVMLAVFNSLKYVLGVAYNKGLEEYTKVHDMFDTLYLAIMFSAYFVAFVLSNGFVSVYTRGADVNYIDSYLPFLFATTKLLSSCRTVCNNTHNIAHRAKQNIIPTIGETIINLVVSLVLVQFIGIYGVLIGTITALFFRTNQTIIYTNRCILLRSSWKTYRIILLYVAIGVLVYCVMDNILPSSYDGYFGLFKSALLAVFITFFIYIVAALLLNKELRSYVRNIKIHL